MIQFLELFKESCDQGQGWLLCGVVLPLALTRSCFRSLLDRLWLEHHCVGVCCSWAHQVRRQSTDHQDLRGAHFQHRCLGIRLDQYAFRGRLRYIPPMVILICRFLWMESGGWSGSSWLWEFSGHSICFIHLLSRWLPLLASVDWWQIELSSGRTPRQLLLTWNWIDVLAWKQPDVGRQHGFEKEYTSFWFLCITHLFVFLATAVSFCWKHQHFLEYFVGESYFSDSALWLFLLAFFIFWLFF